MEDFILYHGTDARISAMSEEERILLRNNIYITLDYLWEVANPFYDPYDDKKLSQIEDKMTNEIFTNFVHALNHENSRRAGHKKWQYQNNLIYLTRDFGKAVRYAYDSYVFGELGKNTWDIYLGINALNLDSWFPNQIVKSTIETLRTLADSTPYPIIYRYRIYDIDENKLKTDEGKKFDEYDQDFSYEFDEFFYLNYRKSNAFFLRPLNDIASFIESKSRKK